ncbi:hypothetical protein PAXINDRAFT_103182 [Paxillus involutus ATCC 200175]|uniref:Uncharacterized protein n=1 Tax=Paxillus involutus ATCC 200175 TaxID=664439 RepID=A0A0C9SMX0_PAXIN|nr:hypothetical protein PAXINDRAFT_103182 [Paxillus involutus ATCC 200175]
MEAIVQRSGDPTLFAWAGKPSPYSRALPSSPACYINPLLRGLPLPVSFVRSGDPFYTVTKVGLQVKLLVVAVECVSVHRGNGSIRHELKSIDRALPQLIITTSFGGDIYPTGSRFALGVVNYRRPSRRVQDDEAHGTLDAGQQYFCVLIDVPSGDPGPRLKIETGNILIIRCTEEFKGELETPSSSAPRFVGYHFLLLQAHHQFWSRPPQIPTSHPTPALDHQRMESSTDRT